MDLSEFFGLRVRVVLALLRNGPMTQTALSKELKAKTRVLKRHLNWLVENGIVIKHGTLYTTYEPNPNHPITKTIQQLIQLSNTRAPKR
jgi:predicted transcriptional regulator